VKTLIVCIGTESIRDDGIGAEVGRILQSLQLPRDVDVLLLPRLNLGSLDALAEADRLILVDALSTGAESGVCTLADVSEIPAAIASGDCAHARIASSIIDLVRYVAVGTLPPGIEIAGIEVDPSPVWGAEFSPGVQCALPRLVDLILLAVGAQVSTRAMVSEIFLPTETVRGVRADVTAL
jgi:hydrogenase maturation protease